MFTGIIETIGEIINLTQEEANLHIEIKSNIVPELKVDQSISHNGVCLTVVKLNQESYVVTENEIIIGTVMFTTKPESSYNKINGSWITNNKPYGVIHRMAIKSEYRNKGIAKFIFSEFENILKNKNIQSMKIDTHNDNLGMKNLLLKMGYSYCGKILLGNGDKRIAFEKKLV